MVQRQFRSDDTSIWPYRFGSGSDGAYAPSTSTDAPIDSACTGTAAATSLTATNASFAAGQLILIHQTQGTGVGNWELNRVASYSTGTITTSLPLINTYATGAQVLVLKQYASALIDTGVTLTAKAWNGTVGGILGWVCLGDTTVTGTITAKGKGHRGGSSFVAGTSQTGHRGEGTVGDNSTAAQSASGTGAGGGMHDSGNRGAGGGGGGHATSGTAGTTNPVNTSMFGGAAGGTAGAAALTTAIFGGGGGSGTGDSGQTVLAGGAGGGLVVIISKGLTITGSINVGGDNGTNAASARSASGAGAGGSALLKSQRAVLGSGLITASGGTGGSAFDTNFEPAGGNGGNGRIHIDYAASLSGTTSPTLDSTQDTTLTDYSGSFIFNMI